MHTEAASAGSTSPRQGWYGPLESVSTLLQQHAPLQQACAQGLGSLSETEARSGGKGAHASITKLAGQEAALGTLE